MIITSLAFSLLCNIKRFLSSSFLHRFPTSRCFHISVPCRSAFWNKVRYTSCANDYNSLLIHNYRKMIVSRVRLLESDVAESDSVTSSLTTNKLLFMDLALFTCEMRASTQTAVRTNRHLSHKIVMKREMLLLCSMWCWKLWYLLSSY